MSAPLFRDPDAALRFSYDMEHYSRTGITPMSYLASTDLRKAQPGMSVHQWAAQAGLIQKHLRAKLDPVGLAYLDAFYSHGPARRRGLAFLAGLPAVRSLCSDKELLAASLARYCARDDERPTLRQVAAAGGVHHTTALRLEARIDAALRHVFAATLADLWGYFTAAGLVPEPGK